MSQNNSLLFKLGAWLYALWFLIIVLWVALYLFQVDGLAPNIRALGDVFMFVTVLLTIVVPFIAVRIRRYGIKVVYLMVLFAWAVVTPLTFILWPQSKPIDFATLVVEFPDLFLSGMSDVLSSPLFVCLYLFGLCAIALLAGLYPHSSVWRVPSSKS